MGISLTEIIVVFLVALILFGPEQLPVLARHLGKVTGQLKKTSDSLRREFYNSVYPPAVSDFRNTLQGEVGALRSLKAEVLAPPVGAVGSPSRKAPEQSVAPDNSEGKATPPTPPSAQQS